MIVLDVTVAFPCSLLHHVLLFPRSLTTFSVGLRIFSHTGKIDPGARSEANAGEAFAAGAKAMARYLQWLVLIVALLGCNASSAQTPDTLVIAFGAEPTTMDP